MELLEVWLILSGLQYAKGSFLLRTVGKTAFISSAYHEENYGPEKALDGNVSTSVHTESWTNSGWWAVDLETEVNSPIVKIYFRLDYKARRNGLRISLYNQLEVGVFCHEIVGDPSGEDIPDVYQTMCDRRGRYLNISTVTSNDALGALVDFAELEVYEKTSCSGPIVLMKHSALVLNETESMVVPAINYNACAKECFSDRLCPAFSFSPVHAQCKIATGVVRASAAPNWDTYGHFIVY